MRRLWYLYRIAKVVFSLEVANSKDKTAAALPICFHSLTKRMLGYEPGDVGLIPAGSTIVTPLGRINHSKTWEHLFYACGRTATHGRDSSVSEFDGRVRIPVTNQMTRLLKCRGPGFYSNISPPSFGMYILSHEEDFGWVCVWSKQTPKGKIRKLFIWFLSLVG